jgi:PPOX class probable F420-dependent enzyme
MAAKMSVKARALLEKPAFAHLATLMRDGSPQVSPVWIDTDGTHLLVNTAEGRIKARNVRRDPRVALSLTDPQNAYSTLLIRGKVVEIRKDGADAHIDKLAKKYLGRDTYPNRRPGEVRIIVVIEPTRIGGSAA